MKIIMDQKLLGIDGKPIKPSPSIPFLTLREVCINSLLTPIDGDDEKEKYNKWEIYKKIRDGKNQPDLTIEDLAKIKNCIGRFQPPLILGQCFEILEQTDKK